METGALPHMAIRTIHVQRRPRIHKHIEAIKKKSITWERERWIRANAPQQWKIVFFFFFFFFILADSSKPSRIVVRIPDATPTFIFFSFLGIVNYNVRKRESPTTLSSHRGASCNNNYAH